MCDQSLTENRLSLLSVWESKELQPGREQAEMLIWGWNDMSECVCMEGWGGGACEGRSSGAAKGKVGMKNVE